MIIIDHEYHVVELGRYIPLEVHDWLRERFGIGDGSRWFVRHNKLYFANKQDHLMFLLRWGSE